MKKILKVILIILSICLFKLIFTTSINIVLINKYNNEIYKESISSLLYILNINESYIAYYNNGNILYKNEEYEKAIEAYEKALDKNPPSKRICSIRVNLALTKLKTIDEQDTKHIVEELTNIQKILYEHDCALEGADIGKDEEADDIDDQIEKLKEQYQDEESNGGDDGKDGDGDDDNGGEENKTNPDDGEIKKIEEQIIEQQRQAGQSRNDSIDYYENRDPTYYEGKRW